LPYKEKKVILLHESQQEQLKEISANLRKIRQDKSIRIEEIAAQTHIRLASLRALEEWRFEELPEPVFIQGFIRRYAEVLGLDGIALANNFQVNLSASEPRNSAKNSAKKFPLRLPPLFIPYILLILAATLGLVYLLKPKILSRPLLKKQESTRTNNQKILTSVLVPGITSTPISSHLPNTTAIPMATASLSTEAQIGTTKVANVAVTLEIKGKSWLQIKADGKTEFAGTLNPGERKTWTAKNDLSVKSGNAGAVLVSVNQQQAEVLGEDGEVKEVTYTNQ
jgi:cytoskeletal protein RodZ